MLRASHSTSVLQSLMCFSQLSCFPLMWPKMTCGLSGKMVSAQDDELPFYFKLSVGSMANRSIKHQTSGHISLSLSYLRYVCYFSWQCETPQLWLTVLMKRCKPQFDNWKVTTQCFAIRDGSNFHNMRVWLQMCKLMLMVCSLALSRWLSLTLSLIHTSTHRLWLIPSKNDWTSGNIVLLHLTMWLIMMKAMTISCTIPARWLKIWPCYHASTNKTNACFRQQTEHL